MITKIGIIAGEIWQCLDKNGKSNLAQLSKMLERPRELVLLSLGWLAREGHVHLGTLEEGFPVHLISR